MGERSLISDSPLAESSSIQKNGKLVIGKLVLRCNEDHITSSRKNYRALENFIRSEKTAAPDSGVILCFGRTTVNEDH